MKNQYFGDINDFRKYGILRKLNKRGLLVCWMLTEDDKRTDGNFTSYLTKPGLYRQYDPALYDSLTLCMKNNFRSVELCSQYSLIGNAGYFNNILTDNQHQRREYFTALKTMLNDFELLFLDPDNGMEVTSVRKGNKNSGKYLYYDEVSELYKMGKSMLIYQHFIREERKKFISRIKQKLSAAAGTDNIHYLRTSNVVFFLIAQDNRYETALAEIKQSWQNQILIDE